MAASAAPPRPRQSPCGSGVRRALRPGFTPRLNQPGHHSNACMGAPVNRHLQLKSLVSLAFLLSARSPPHALTHLPWGRGPDLSRTDRSRRLVSGRASRLATLIPPARNGLRIGRTHLSFGSFSKHCSGHVHPSSEASTPLKPSTPRLRESVPSRQTATEPPPACAPRPRLRCASGAPWRS